MSNFLDGMFGGGGSAFMEGFMRTREMLQQRKRLQQQDSLAMQDRDLALQDRERGIQRQTAADQIAAQERTQQQALRSFQIPAHLAELGSVAEDPQGAQALIESAMPNLMNAFGQESMAYGMPAIEQATRTITGRQRAQVEAYLNKWKASEHVDAYADVPAEKIELPLPDHLKRYLGKPSATLAELQQFAQLPVGKPAGKTRIPPAAGSMEEYADPATTPERRAEIERLRRGYTDAGRAPDININMPGMGNAAIEAPLDPDSQDIMSQAGLSYNAFLAATGDMSKLSRDRATRNAATQEVQRWARERGIDVSTLQSQFKASNEVLKRNIMRYNKTLMAEGEIIGDVENLVTAAKESGLNDVRAINAAKLWINGELNDPAAATYAMHLNQLRNDLALYNSASRDGSGEVFVSDMKEAENVIKQGISTGSLSGLQAAINRSVEKMGGVLEEGVNRARKDVWTLFGVGDKYRPQGRAQARGGGASSLPPMAPISSRGPMRRLPGNQSASPATVGSDGRPPDAQLNERRKFGDELREWNGSRWVLVRPQ